MADSVQRPTILDLAKAQRSIGVTGEWKCSCGRSFRWRLDHSRLLTLSDEPPSIDDLNNIEHGFIVRLQQEIEEHIAVDHAKTAASPASVPRAIAEQWASAAKSGAV